MKRCPLVMIVWEDSEQPVSAWTRLADFEQAAPMRVHSVGWLVQDDADMKALAPNVGGIDANTAQAAGIIRIPARCVVSVRKKGAEAYFFFWPFVSSWPSADA